MEHIYSIMRFRLSVVSMILLLISCSQEKYEDINNETDNGTSIIHSQRSLFKKDRCSFEEAVEQILEIDTIVIDADFKEQDMPIFE
ncbi:MAG: hypothetical protein ACJ0QP_05765 [Schleiferiaceae bacterium]